MGHEQPQYFQSFFFFLVQKQGSSCEKKDENKQKSLLSYGPQVKKHKDFLAKNMFYWHKNLNNQLFFTILNF